jgi:uncharacterized protein YjiS (DUF1127 family)
MNGHAYSRAAAEWIFTPWGRSSKQESQNAPSLINRDFVQKFNILRTAAVTRVLNRLYLWQDRAEQRARLSEMDARMLKDIGVTRPEAAAEARKPFWTA